VTIEKIIKEDSLSQRKKMKRKSGKMKKTPGNLRKRIPLHFLLTHTLLLLLLLLLILILPFLLSIHLQKKIKNVYLV